MAYTSMFEDFIKRFEDPSQVVGVECGVGQSKPVFNGAATDSYLLDDDQQLIDRLNALVSDVQKGICDDGWLQTSKAIDDAIAQIQRWKRQGISCSDDEFLLGGEAIREALDLIQRNQQQMLNQVAHHIEKIRKLIYRTGGLKAVTKLRQSGEEIVRRWDREMALLDDLPNSLESLEMDVCHQMLERHIQNGEFRKSE